MTQIADTETSSRGLTDRVAWQPLGFVLFVAMILAAIPVFWLGFEALASAWSTAEYSHGPLIPIVSLYLFLRELRKTPLPKAQVTDGWIGLLVMAAALSLAVLGNLMRVPDIVTYALIFGSAAWFWRSLAGIGAAVTSCRSFT